ncbi:hypothetical protein [Jiangella alkaliphila]|uniref:Uncharacterized protein n=1 Tax=Jiangella alkaliphila TaxID=419479 RepID=A0A1H2K8Q2_9ACTN|nr:hypothetical protein [Jiangella alkaliphila]SDU65084.1 hypothetical protein SAMN04488563_3556 [Jiangella alkaliphila]
MLTPGKYARLAVALFGLVLSLLVGGSAAQAAPASAAADAQPRADCTVPPGWTESYVNENGDLVTVTHCPGGDEGGDEGGGDEGGGNEGGGSQEPSCEFVDLYNEYCDGPNPCWMNVPAAIEDHPDLPQPKPSPDSIPVYWRCRNPDDSYYDGYEWLENMPVEVEPPLEQQAMTAYGLLVVPDFTLAFNPPEQAYVNLDTWWWADGIDDEELVGSSAFGVVAIATPDHLEVQPGDGSAAFDCDWVTAESETCNYSYARASISGTVSVDGKPAYDAQARLVYTVRFENGGAPLVLPGLPTELTGDWQNTPVPVAEIQSIVE